MPDVVVVGAGHNGLTAAAFLAREGLEVVVVERRPVPGGAVATEELVPGYRFSTCAYAVHLLHEEVAERLALDVRMIPLPPRVGVLPDGSVVRDDELEPEGYARWEAFWQEPSDARSIRSVLHETFASPEARCLYAPRYADFPLDAPGGVGAYAWMESGRLREPEWQGIPEGGMEALARAFARAAEEAGARLLLGREVVRIGSGVVLADGERIDARVVVSNADPVHTFRLAGRELDVDLRPAGAKLHLALRAPPELPGDGGLIHLYPSLDWYERCWPDAAEDSLVELQWPSAGRSLSAYVPYAPWGRRDELARLLLERVRAVVPDLDDLLVGWALHAPEDIEARVGLTGAQIHHLPHAPGVVRPGPATDIPGLFLCGAGSPPGGEVSGLPGLNAARAVIEHLS